MARRAFYAFGGLLDLGPHGFVTCGIGIGSARKGRTISYISPTDRDHRDRHEAATLAGLEFEFLYAPDTEAPEEMHIWIPELKALTCAENANHSLHNIQTLRGARTRDARNFARYLDETLERWGDEAEVHYGPHTWPVWGNENVVGVPRIPARHLQVHPRPGAAAGQQGLHRRSRPPRSSSCPTSSAASGTTAATTAPCTTTCAPCTPRSSACGTATRCRCTRTRRSSPPTRFVDLIGADKILAEGQRAFDAGDYRWAVEILHKLVFARTGQPARPSDLQADAYEQMGYQAEGPQWRGIFLTAAQELREGVAARRVHHGQPGQRSWRCRSTSCSTSPPCTSSARRRPDVDLRIDFDFTDLDETWTMWVRRGVLNARGAAHPAGRS